MGQVSMLQGSGAKRFTRYQVLETNLEALIQSDSMIEDLKEGLEGGVVFKIPHQIPLAAIKDFRDTLLTSLSYKDPGYSERKHGCANNYRVHWDDKMQAIKAKFLSWSFYPWNNDSLEWFAHFRNLFVLRNKLAGLEADTYINSKSQNFAARIAAQFYPAGVGYMEEHTDPYDVHQFAIPTLLLSTPGVDFTEQGLFLLDSTNERVYLDKFLSFGDLFLFHTRIPHGVGVIDGHIKFQRSKRKGRLMMIAAVNALADQSAYQSRPNDV